MTKTPFHFPAPPIRAVRNRDGHTVTVLPKNGGGVVLEAATDTAVVSVTFATATELLALAGHLYAVANDLHPQREEVAVGDD